MRKSIDGLIIELQALSASQGNIFISVKGEVKDASGVVHTVEAEAHSLQVKPIEGGSKILIISSNDSSES